VQKSGVLTPKFSSDATLGPNHKLSGVTFDRCVQADIGRVPTRNCVFSGYTLDTDGALLWNANIDIKNSKFIGNTDATNDPHAIEHPAAGEFTYDNLQFSGNDYDINNSSGGDVTIYNTNGANASTYENTAGGSTTIPAAVYTIEFTGLQANSEVRIYKDSDDSEIAGTENSSTTFSHNYEYSEDIPIYVRIHHIDYEWVTFEDLVLSNSNQSIPIQQRFDRNYSNP